MLILASTSPRRHEILEAAGIPHVVQPAGIEETRLPGESLVACVQRLAAEKAQAISLPSPDDIVLGADTMVSIDNHAFGKPLDDEDLARMLGTLSGRVHTVTTAVCLRTASRTIQDLSTTQVEFVKLTDSEMKDYTQSGEGRDKAGAYAIQGRAGRFVRRIEGCYHNVVGLPLSLVYGHLRSLRYL